MNFWSSKFVHETEIERKIGLVWIYNLKFFRKVILLRDLEIFSILAQYGCLRPGASL